MGFVVLFDVEELVFEVSIDFDVLVGVLCCKIVIN